MEDNLKEKNFEADIERWLLEEGGYERGYQITYNKDAAIDMTALIEFVYDTQPKQWERYQKIYGASAGDQFYKVMQDDISRYGLIYVLRHGIDDRGVKIKLTYFAPPSELNEDLMRKYRANRLSVTRQFAYSSKHHNTIDMVLSLNGIPIIAIELKNQLTGQSVEDSKQQWMEDREPNEFLFHPNNRILAYFGADLYEVWMTTKLDKDKTFFIPFNRGSNGAGNVGGAGNPAAAEGEYVTGYFWKEVLQRDALLAILQRYISVQKDVKIKIVVDKHGKEKEVKKEETKIIFPRFHQRDVVEKLTADTLSNGSGKNYLIQHSAGSGKSNSIAWLTFRLASLHDAAQKEIFDKVFVITDRRILNKQLQETILGFDHTLGHVEVIRNEDPSTKLRDIINGAIQCKIVICTLHRFPVIYKEVESQSGKHYAIIVDEAHSSQSGKSAEKTKAALADTDEALRELAEIEEKEVEELEKEKDALMEDLLAQGQHSNLSFYAFTATPKPKTLQTFGVAYPDPENPGQRKYRPCHTYSMQQAIEEGFIKDVLLNFTNITTAYEIAKNVAENPDYEETPATRAIKAFHDNHQHVIDQKVEIVVEKICEVTLQRMNGEAKAMVVCPSRAHALRYFLAMKEYCKRKGYHDVRPLVAFSGKLKFNGETYTEPQLNSTPERKISEERLPLYFASDLYNVLIVADKYQTGFDEPRLHTMFVDKRLKEVKAVQTLSRLNRWQKLKKDTFVFDFCNTPDDIKKSFEPFYTATDLVQPVDVNYVYRFRKDIAQYHLWTVQDEAAFYELYKKYVGKKNALGALSSFFKPIMNRYEEVEEEKRFEIRSKIKNFIRFYSYMAQIARTFDRDLYKAYVFADTLYKLLPKNPHEKPDLNKKILLINSQFKIGETVAISLEGNAPVKGESGNGGGKPDNKRDLLSNIIDKINIMYQGNFSEADRVIVEAIVRRLTTTVEGKKLSKKAASNGREQFMEAVFPGVFNDVATSLYEEQTEAFKSLFDNGEKYRQIMSQMASALYDHFRDAPLIFDPEAFRKAMYMTFADEFEDFKGSMRGLNEVIEVFVKVLQAKSLPSLDGANDLLIDSFNRLFNDKKLTLVDRRRHFNTILTKLETYLKKLYWLIHGEEIQGRDGKSPALTDCIFAFEELKSLKFKDRKKYKRMYQYLDQTRSMRNDESHITPETPEEEIIDSSKVVATIYLYITAQSIIELESAGKI